MTLFIFNKPSIDYLPFVRVWLCRLVPVSVWWRKNKVQRENKPAYCGSPFWKSYDFKVNGAALWCYIIWNHAIWRINWLPRLLTSIFWDLDLFPVGFPSGQWNRYWLVWKWQNDFRNDFADIKSKPLPFIVVKFFDSFHLTVDLFY